MQYGLYWAKSGTKWPKNHYLCFYWTKNVINSLMGIKNKYLLLNQYSPNDGKAFIDIGAISEFNVQYVYLYQDLMH